MTIVSRILIVGLLGLAQSCAPMPSVPLDATPADLEMLAGEWQGEYTSIALGRKGGIEFKLRAGTDEAFGDVLMQPATRNRPYPEDSTEYNYRPPGGTNTELLTIRFIRAEHGAVTGMLDPYWDPDRNCTAMTVFRGHIGKGIVQGTFLTKFDCGAGDATGQWRVTKKTSQQRSAGR
jgi:hypothetical protein